MTQPWRQHFRHRFSAAMAIVMALTLFTVLRTPEAAVAAEARAGSPCAAMTAPVYQRINPSTSATLLTRSRSESVGVARRGFTDNRGLPFKAAAAPGTGLVAAHRMHLPRVGNFVWMTSPTEISRAKKQGYRDQGVNFYVSSKPSTCLTPVYRYRKAGIHRFAIGDVGRAAAAAAGWRQEGVAFYAAPPAPEPTGDTKFSIVVFPDTQGEVTRHDDPRFLDRTRWTVNNRRILDTRFVIQTGDLVNWDSKGHEQFYRASAGMKMLDHAGLPYAIAVGNHDTGVVCGSGSACPGKKPWVAVRDTSTINRFFPPNRFSAMRGQFERGKIDNSFLTFAAGGRDWLVLSVELWPRASAVQWAKGVIRSHPRENVIIATHSYLQPNGTIFQRNGGYGANSPQYIYEQLVHPYPNVRLVLSGHVGDAASRVDTAQHGNSVVALLGNFSTTKTNPTRILDIDTRSNTVSTRVYAPYTNTDYPQFSRTFYGMSWVG